MIKPDTHSKSIIAPLVEKIEERVRRGEVDEEILAIGKYMTDPAAPFLVPDDELSDFYESIRLNAIKANKLDAG